MSDRKVKVRRSKDGGHNYGEWKEHSLGELGEYQDRVNVTFRRLGIGKQFQFDIEVSSPIKASVLAAYGDIEALTR